MENLLSSLNEQQRKAVEYCDGPQLVIAGAGSGKTRVLTYKIAYLLEQGLAPWNVLALTFTNKAANEMKERIGQLVGIDRARMLRMGTFHSVFLRILRAEAEAIGFKPNFTIYDDADSRSLVTAIVKELGLDDKTYKASTLLGRIGMAKNSLITPEMYAADGSLLERDRNSRMPATASVYQIYAARCHAANALDFDDMLLFTHCLFSSYPDICEKYAERFRYILVDEYQDTNYAQQCIVTLLTRHNRHVCVVGDDAQSIYAFRGANIDNMLDFQKIYPDAKVFKLERNYRSTQNIVNAANCLIQHNQRQIHKNVFSENEEGEKVCLCQVYSDKEEAAFVAKEIIRIRRKEKVPFNTFCILYRTNAQSRVVEEELRRQGLPYHIFGGQSFYQRKEIKDVLAYLRLVANPDDEEALKRVINYPARGIGATTMQRLFDAAHQNGVSVWTVLSNPQGYGVKANRGILAKLNSFYGLISRYVSQRESMDAYALGDALIKESGVSEAIFSDNTPEGLARQDNVGEFVSGLKDFVDSKREEGNEGEVYVSFFLQEVALVSDNDNDDEKGDGDGQGKVSLMTIHASKGLEFSTVFIVGVEENLFPALRSCNSLREIEEERRLLYVAITRAERHCFITFARSRYQYGNMAFNPPSRFIKDLDPAYVSAEGMMPRVERGGSVSADRPRASFRPSVAVADSRAAMPSFRPVSSLVPKASAVRPSSASSAGGGSKALPEGTIIEHQRFGVGKVVKVEGTGENTKATVDFRNVGTKQLLLKFAKFKIVDNM